VREQLEQKQHETQSAFYNEFIAELKNYLRGDVNKPGFAGLDRVALKAAQQILLKRSPLSL
jgi:hypothetical protein